MIGAECLILNSNWFLKSFKSFIDDFFEKKEESTHLNP